MDKTKRVVHSFQCVDMGKKAMAARSFERSEMETKKMVKTRTMAGSLQCFHNTEMEIKTVEFTNPFQIIVKNLSKKSVLVWLSEGN